MFQIGEVEGVKQMDYKQERCVGTLSETGIILKEGTEITEGTILEAAREAVRLYECNTSDEYENFMYGESVYAALSKEDKDFLCSIWVPEQNTDMLNILVLIEGLAGSPDRSTE